MRASNTASCLLKSLVPSSLVTANTVLDCFRLPFLASLVVRHRAEPGKGRVYRVWKV